MTTQHTEQSEREELINVVLAEAKSLEDRGEVYRPKCLRRAADLLAATPAREWVGLTEDDIFRIRRETQGVTLEFARAIESKLREKNAALLAEDKAGGEPVAWRELCRRLYAELFHCDQQMTSGSSPKWKQGATVRDVLRDAKQALDTHHQPQAERVPEGWKLVPVEPTLEMIDSANRARLYREHGPLSDPDVLNARTFNTVQAYAAMLAAAPKPQDSKETGE